MQTVALVGKFEENALRLLGQDLLDEVIAELAASPTSGVLIQGTGGLRKKRVRRPGSGTSGGARVIYYYHDRDHPLWLIAIYAKADQENLSAQQKKVLRELVRKLTEGERWTKTSSTT